MVMHARKHPRLNDGYYDRNSPDMLQNAQYPSKTNHSERYRSHDRDSSPEDRDSPRYVNKSSYIERAREKVERSAPRSSLDSRINHLTSSGMSSNTLASLVHKNAIARSTAVPSSSSRSSSSMSSVQRSKSYSASSHIASSSSRDGKSLEARKADILKSARRVCGDWSEHISSSGKKYYYNCQTEVSQWEKPRQWMDMYREINRGESKELDRRQLAAKSYNDRGKHSIQSEKERIVLDRNNSRNSTSSDIANRQNYLERHGLPKSNSVPSSAHLSSVPGYNKQQQHRHQSSSDQLSSSSHYQGTSENELHRQSSGGAYRDYSSTSSYRDESTSYQREIGHGGSTNMLTTSESIRYERGDCETNAVSMADGYSSSRSSDIRRNETDNSQNIDGMEISPSRTPTSSSSFSRANSRQHSHTPQQAHPQHVQHHTASVIDSFSVNTASRLLSSHSPLSPSRGGTSSNLLSPGSASMSLPSLSSLQSSFTSAIPQGISALPHLISHLSERQQKDSQDKNQKALHTLQMLQEALTRQVSLAQTMVQSQGTTSSLSNTTNTHLASAHNNNSTQPYSSSSSSLINNIAINTSVNNNSATSTTITTSHSVTTPNQMNSPSPHRGVMKSPLRTGFSTQGMHSSTSLGSNMTTVSSSPLHSSTVPVSETNSNFSTTVMLTSRVGGPHSDENGSRPCQELSPSRSPAHTVKEEACVNGGHGTVLTPFELSSSHIDYYNEELRAHVKGWQSNEIQKQVVKVMEEGVLVHQGQCAVICAELKRARSLVRLTEIQSTLHEQRILSLKHHAAEIESMKTQTNFMSS